MLGLTRRDLVLRGSAAFAAFAVLHASRAGAFPSRPGETVIPWLDQPAENPVPGIIHNQLVWEDFDSWITPNDKFFFITNIDGARPEIDAATWKLEVDGLVGTPLSLSLDDLKARPRREATCTMECSGNSGLPFLTGAVGNAKWAGTSAGRALRDDGHACFLPRTGAGPMLHRCAGLPQRGIRRIERQGLDADNRLAEYSSAA
jgi:DMSO/TMAO reductase YedYZ molybdopterin-dependent catalytic subunit